VATYGGLKQKKILNFKLWKWSWSLTRGSKNSDLTSKLLVFWKTGHSGEVVAYERWLKPEVQLELASSYSWRTTRFVPFFRNKFPGLFQDFSRTFPGLFQDSDWFFHDSKIYINPFTLKIPILILLAVCHTFHIFYLNLTDFQYFPGPVALFQDFPVLENATLKFQDFPGFPGPVWTLVQV